jgi:hypothetical protein
MTVTNNELNSKSALPNPSPDLVRVRIILTATSVTWQWQAERCGELIATERGRSDRRLPLHLAERVALLMAQRWMVENDAVDAEVVIGGSL